MEAFESERLVMGATCTMQNVFKSVAAELGTG